MDIIITMHLFITNNSESTGETILKLKKIHYVAILTIDPIESAWTSDQGTNFTILVYLTFHTVHNFNTLVGHSAYIVFHWICLFWYRNCKSSASNEDYPIILKKIFDLNWTYFIGYSVVKRI